MRVLAALELFTSPASPLYAAATRLSCALDIPEARSFLGIHLAQMTVSCEAIDSLTKRLCPDDSTRGLLFQSGTQSNALRHRSDTLTAFLSHSSVRLPDLIVIWLMWRTLSFCALWPILLHTSNFPEGDGIRSWSRLVIRDLALNLHFTIDLLCELRPVVDLEFAALVGSLLAKLENDVIQGELCLHDYLYALCLALLVFADWLAFRHRHHWVYHGVWRFDGLCQQYFGPRHAQVARGLHGRSSRKLRAR